MKRNETLFQTLKRKSKTMTATQLKIEYNWINPAHLERLLAEIFTH